MKKTEGMEGILQLKELRHPQWEGKMKRAAEQARMENGEEWAEAQETLENLILSLGGIREDVFEYLMIPRFQSTEAVMSIGRLLCYAAPVEWIALAVKALERTAGSMYVNEITECYQAGLSVEEVEGFLKGSQTVFEMCQYRRLGFTDRKRADSTAGSREMETADKLTGSEDKPKENTKYGDLTEVITAAVIKAMRQSGQIPGQINEDVADSVTGSGELETADSMTGSGGLEEEDSVTGSEEAFFPEEIPEFPDGSELSDHRILVKELTEAEKEEGKRISFFQILLSRHMKKAFLKLEPEDQVNKLFEIMMEKKYKKKKVLAVRRLMKGGMSNGFLFSLLEKDFSEEELEELCETLLEEDMGAEKDTWEDFEQKWEEEV